MSVYWMHTYVTYIQRLLEQFSSRHIIWTWDALSIDCHQHPEGCLENNIFIEIIFSDLVARKWQAAIVKQLIIRVQ